MFLEESDKVNKIVFSSNESGVFFSYFTLLISISIEFRNSINKDNSYEVQGKWYLVGVKLNFDRNPMKYLKGFFSFAIL